MISVLLVTPDGERRYTEEDPEAGDVRLLVRELTMLEVERALILYYLDRCGGSQRRAAVALGLPRSTLNDRVRRWGLVATAVEVAK